MNSIHLGRRALPVFISILAGAMFISSCYEIKIASYNPESAYNGLTIFYPFAADFFQIVDMEGNVVTQFECYQQDLDLDFEILENGDILIQNHAIIYLLRLPGTVVWSLSAPSSHHCAIPMPNGHIMYLFAYNLPVDGWDMDFLADGIREVDPATSETVWEWRAGDHISTDDYCSWHIMPSVTAPGSYDWTHANTIVYREEESAVYLNIRHLDRFVKIDYPSGEVLWSMGRGGDFGEGLFSHSHDPEFLENGNIVMFDNGNHRFPVEYSRAVEIAYDDMLGWAEVVWAWPTEPLFFDSAMGDANRLPNGNTLITSSHHGRIYEVTQSGEIAWEMYLEPPYSIYQPLFYKSERTHLLDWLVRGK